jgi:alkylation response protein AidB-like acyl-CoA dehydrogenase
MAGNTEFCEVFYADVRIPLTNVVGAIGGGWKVAMSTLSFERGTSYLAEQVRLSQEVDSLVDFARSTPATRSPGSLIDDGAIASRLAALRSEVSALKALTYSAISRWEHSGAPGVEGSIVRLYHSELLQRVFAFGMELRGWDALAIAPDEYDGSWTRTYLDSYATTIVGGTSDIQRNIIGERLLGLPRDRP